MSTHVILWTFWQEECKLEILVSPADLMRCHVSKAAAGQELDILAKIP